MDLLGFVDNDSGGGPAGTFELTRFYVSCSAADAIPYSVAVDPGSGTGGLEDDSWAHVTGVLASREGRFVLVADQVRSVARPEEPYLY